MLSLKVSDTANFSNGFTTRLYDTMFENRSRIPLCTLLK